MEAREFTATYNLAAHVSPVSDALVEEQDRQLKATYLQFPSHAAKIVVVDSVETVTYMAQVLGFTLQKQSSSTSCASSSAEPFDINDAASQEANEKFHHTKLRLRDVLQAISQNRFNIAVSAEMEVVGKTDSNATTEITANATVFSSIPPLVSSNVSNKSRSGNTFRNVIGLDAEWKVEMYTNSSDCGAGVLQVSEFINTHFFPSQNLIN